MLQDKVKKVEQRADVASRQSIQESYSTVAKDWRDIQDGLMMRCSDLNDLVDTWEVRILRRSWFKDGCNPKIPPSFFFQTQCQIIFNTFAFVSC